MWPLIITESLCAISGLPSSIEICTFKRVMIARAIPLNFLAEDNFPALADILMMALILESKMQLSGSKDRIFVPQFVDNSNSVAS